ncbi:MAG: hypothetical protein IJE81_03935 [Oscillospiraceae bacterium]|nr:hypothetical protein [Oscillospiraceae bacterium]MBQ7129535.1 hypothetical protein [Oscillospiraceae bacterium]
MKHRKNRCATRQPMYPNAADPRYFQEKSMNIFAAILSGTGALTAMLFFVTMA